MSDKDALIGLVSEVTGDRFLKVEENLGAGFVRLKIAEAERRQAKHDIRSVEDVVVELLRNARDAHAQRIFVATSREGDVRHLTMIDDGVGIPEELHGAVFEPRVTSKLETMVMDRWGVHGRGMALYSIKSNVTSCRVAASSMHKGASVYIETDPENLPERTDQSSWPTVDRDEQGALQVARGPHNIIRKVLEFACEHPEVDVFIGSPVEVLATLHLMGRDCLDSSELLFCDDYTKLPVWQRPGTATDSTELVEIAESLAIPISERTAHRVFAGDLASLESVLHQVDTSDDEAIQAKKPDIYRDRRGLQIHHSDLASFRQELTSAFDSLAEKYYLHLRGEPKISIGRDGIRVRFEVDKED